MPAAGHLIWTALVPMLKIVATIGAGFTLTRRGLFPAAASKGFAQITMNLALPCLIFSSIVPSFNTSNIANLGPLIMTALFYELTGLAMGFILREFLYVPKDFRYGILIMTALSNWGNLPTAIVQSVAANAPFDPTTDPTLGVGFVSVFICVYQTSFFTGVYKMVAWDYIDTSPEGPRETLSQKWKRRKLWLDGKRGRGGRRTGRDRVEEGESGEDDTVALPELQKGRRETDTFDPRKDVKSRQVSFGQQQQQDQQVAFMDRLTRQTSAAQAESIVPKPLDPPSDFLPLPSPSNLATSSSSVIHRTPHPPSSPLRSAPSVDPQSSSVSTSAALPTTSTTPPLKSSEPRTVLGGVVEALKSIASPITISLVVALVVALVNPIKALFVANVEGWSGIRVKLGPDGRPALVFVLETAVFIGAICVPGALILLGASFARLKVPKVWSDLPIAAILAVTAWKMILLPCIGIAFVQTLSAKTSLYPKEDKILSFVAMILSSSPAAINHLFIVTLVAPEGNTDTIAAFLLPQYLFLAISSTIVTTVSLNFVS